MPFPSDDLARRRARLSPQQLAAFERRIQEARSPRARDRQIPHAPAREDWPLSFAQERLWFLHQLDPTSAAYNRPAYFRLTGTLDVAALERTLATILRRHAILRARFRVVQGRPRQVVLDDRALSLPLVDLTSELPEARQENAQQLAVAEARHPFDLAAGPLVRGRLLKLSIAEHVLLLTFHHTVFDAWSEHILKKELAQLYAAYSAGKPSPLLELPIHYTDYAVWQREWLEGETRAELTSYWRRRLEGAPAVLELPTDRPHPSVRTDRGARLTRVFPPTLAESLRDLSYRHEATLFMTLLAAFQMLLHRYTGRTDLLVGTPVAGRSRVEFEDLLGLFVNLVPLRTHISTTETLQDFLAAVRSAALGAFAHQDLPFEKLVEALAPWRHLDRSPLVQVTFQLRNLPPLHLEPQALRIDAFPVDTASTPFDLSLDVTDSAEGLACTAIYSTELFHEATIRRMLGHYCRLLEEIADDSRRRLSDFDLVTADEWNDFQTRWNRRRSAFPVDLTLHELFEAQAARTPEAVALTLGARQLTYRELNARANQLARFLRARGVGSERLVAVVMGRSLETVVAILGILKAGGAYVPFDVTHPLERLRFMLRDTGPVAILADIDGARQLSDSGAPVIDLHRDWSTIVQESDANLDRMASSENLAYVIYTSGSTGRPKGVMVEHRQVVRLFAATRDEFEFGTRDVWTLLHSFAFDVSVWELFGGLLSGGRLVIVPREVAQSPADFRTLLCGERVTVLTQTPSAFRPLSHVDEEATQSPERLSLRVVIFCGERLEPGHLKSWMERHGDEHPRLINMYGITETTVHATLRRMTTVDLECPTGSPIGVPLADLKLLLLDEGRRPVPCGVTGEIYVGGAGVARGYLNRPDLTAERFLADPFEPRTAARLYRSGDLARRLPNGDVEYLGRADQQVKIRGFRVELGEIEAALDAHPQVAESAVLLSGSDPNRMRLVAYVVLRLGHTVSDGDLLGPLRDQLPDYMIPAAIVVLPRLPLTTNGKLDRAALPDPGSSRPDLRAPYAAPRTPIEEELAKLWNELLEVAPVGIDDNFFELGGHSLLAVQMATRVRDRLHWELPLRHVFDAPTIRRLSANLGSRNEPAAPSVGQPIPPVPRHGRISVSFGQEQVVLASQLVANESVYNESLAIRISGALDVAVLMRCLNALGQRHEVLRTNIRTEGDQLVQIIHDQITLPLSIVDLTSHPEDIREDEAIRLADQEVRQPFDLSQGRLVRATLFILGEQDRLLCLACHHAIVDGVSAHVLIDDLAELYETSSRHEASRLSTLPIQYADFAVAQRDRIPPDVWQEQLAYWQTKLAGAAPLELAGDRPRPPLRSGAGGRVSVNLPAPLCDALQAFSRREQVTFFMTLLATFKALLRRYTGQDDVIVGTVVADRGLPETHRLIGYFLKTLALRSDLSGEPTFRELLHRVRDVVVEALTYQDVPFLKVVEHLGPDRTEAGNPVFNVAFVLEPAVRSRHSHWRLNQRKGYSGTAKFDLMLLMDQTPRANLALIEYDADLFDAPTIQRMLAHYQTLLEAVVADADRSISTLPLLTEGEERLLASWTTAGCREAVSGCLHELFEEQVERSPNAAAVTFEDATLTYRELNDRANQLAHHLRAHGVCPETPVALCLARSVDLIIGLLGILKAGGAYVPLDPSQPPTRSLLMVEDAGVRAVVTQAALAHHFAGVAAPIIRLDADALEIAAERVQNPTPSAAPEHLAYVIYTSGSTGRPKGVAVEHRQIVNYVHGIIERLQLAPGLRYATVSTIAADLGNTVIFPSLSSGGCLHVISDERATDPQALAEYFVHHQIDCLKIVPSHLAALHAGAPPEQLMPRRCLILGGEASRCEFVAKLHALSPGTAIYNHYGPTETTVGVLAGRVGPRELAAPSGMLPLGSPLRNIRAHILDEHRHPVPVGVPGELYIGGDGVARGYVNRPELTAASFVPDPFSNDSIARLYKTGDRARYLPHGDIEFLGRGDDQVKIRGFRVELGEIEAALRQHPAVHDVVALLQEWQSGDPRLVAYVVGRRASRPDPAGPRTCRLPNDMQVAHINKGETDYVYREIFELQAYLKHGISLHDGDCVIDVGANIGLFTLFANQVCRDPRIYAFEPDPTAFEALRANAVAHGVNARLFNFGLADVNATAEFTSYEGFSLLSGFHADAAAEKGIVRTYLRNRASDGEASATELAAHADELLNERFAAKTFTCERRTLSDVIAAEAILRIDLLKINVEKSEVEVLRGIAAEDWAKIGQVVIEIDVPEQREAILELLEGRGYELCVEQDPLLKHTPLCYVYAIRPSARHRLIRNQPPGAHLRVLPVVAGEGPGAAELQEYVSRRLPGHMVPDAFVAIDSLPLTPNGKLDRRALPKPGAKGRLATTAYVAPRTPVEEILADIWRNVLGVDRVGINDNFFDVGGHSLLVMRVVARIRGDLAANLSMRTVFQAPTVAKLAPIVLASLLGRDKGDATPPSRGLVQEIGAKKSEAIE
jgi:amino acid adenylation domain-containing protein/FkbM family methyltransferase